MQSRQPNNTKLVVGLGNPGRQYAGTRHNVGFCLVRRLAERWDLGKPRRAFGSLAYDARVARGSQAARVMMLMPQAYMNRSGQAVRDMAAFYKIGCQDILIVLDDMALPPGRLRARASGSAGGHNGLADVLAMLGSEEVPRLRIGIGPAPEQMDPADYVLSKFRPDEMETIERAIRLAADAVEDWAFEPIAGVMEKYNRNDDATTPDSGKQVD